MDDSFVLAVTTFGLFGVVFHTYRWPWLAWKMGRFIIKLKWSVQSCVK